MDVHAKTNISDRVAAVLLDRIIAGQLDKGEPLSSERELMREFDVSRLTCREALAKLRGMGIIESRHGKGAFLTDMDNSCITPTTLKFLQAHGHISNDNVIEARLIIEPVAANRAALNADSSQKEQIFKQANKDRLSLEGLSIVERASHFAEVDISFHQSIASASDNPVLPLLLKSMHELLLRVRLEALILRPDIAIRALADHKRIASCISQGNAEEAQKAMQRHIHLRSRELLQCRGQKR